MSKSEADKWCDQREAMFNAWERKNKFYCEMSGKKKYGIKAVILNAIANVMSARYLYLVKISPVN